MMSRWFALILAVLFALPGVARAETWRVVYNEFPPYSDTTAAGEPVGFAIDLLRAATRGLDVELEFLRSDNPGDALRMIARGAADLHPHLAPNAERAEILSFTTPIKSFQVRAYQRADRARPDDLTTFAGQRIGVASGSLPDFLASRYDQARIVRSQDNASLFFALASGEVDLAFYADNAFESILKDLDAEERFVAVGPALTTRDVTMAVSRERPRLADTLDARLRALVDTTEYWQIHAAWFGAEPQGLRRTEIAYLGGGLLGLALLAVLVTFMVMRYRAHGEIARQAERSLAEQRKLVDLLEIQNRTLEANSVDMQQMLYVVSHDLKSPLVSIAGFAEMLDTAREEEDPDARIEMMDMAIARIHANIGHMRRMIGNILELRKLEEERASYAVFSLDAMMADIEVGLAAELDTPGCELRVPPLGDALGDRNLIQQAVQNLVENALRHGRRGGAVQVEILRTEDEDTLSIGVRDHGPGVPSEHAEAVFELHQRLKKNGEGLGIGLAIVRRVALCHDGRAYVEPTPGGGATFWLRLSKRPRSGAETRGMEFAA